MTVNLEKYAEEIGGVFSIDDIEAIPYNHWRQDCQWMVLVVEPNLSSAFVPVEALTPREACTLAIKHYLHFKELYE